MPSRHLVWAIWAAKSGNSIVRLAVGLQLWGQTVLISTNHRVEKWRLRMVSVASSTQVKAPSSRAGAESATGLSAALIIFNPQMIESARHLNAPSPATVQPRQEHALGARLKCSNSQHRGTANASQNEQANQRQRLRLHSISPSSPQVAWTRLWQCSTLTKLDTSLWNLAR